MHHGASEQHHSRLRCSPRVDRASASSELQHHTGRFYAALGLYAGWLSEVRQLIGALDAALLDLRGAGFDALLDPDD